MVSATHGLPGSEGGPLGAKAEELEEVRVPALNLIAAREAISELLDFAVDAIELGPDAARERVIARHRPGRAKPLVPSGLERRERCHRHCPQYLAFGPVGWNA